MAAALKLLANAMVYWVKLQGENCAERKPRKVFGLIFRWRNMIGRAGIFFKESIHGRTKDSA